MRQNHNKDDLDKIFRAKSLAIIGASTNTGKLGYTILETLLKGGFEGRIYPVNPKGGEVLGLQIFHSITEVPEVVDTMIIVIPSPFVPDVLTEAGRKGVRTAVIISSGFKEGGRLDLEDAIINIAKEYNIHFLGPNIQGVYCPPNKMSAAFWPVLKKAGPVAVIAQSGSVAAYLAEQLELENIGISAAVNLGNKTNIDECDMLEYFAYDPDTRAIALYLEGLKDGRFFLETIRKVLPQKPIVIMKSGRTISGARSAESHTGALATNDAIFSAACRQYGLFRSLTMESLLDAVKGLTMIKPPKGNRLMVISSSGGGNTLAVDAADDCNLEIPSVSDDFVEKVRKNLNLPFNATISNPCDLSFFEGSLFREIVNLADQYNLADTFLLNYGDPIPNGVQAARDLERAIDSSIVVAYFGGGEMEKQGQLQLHEYGIPVFPTPERAITGIHAAVDYATYRNSLQA